MTNEQVFGILKKLIENGSVSPDQIQEAVDEYISTNGIPITPASVSKINEIIDTRLDNITIINCTSEEKQNDTK